MSEYYKGGGNKFKLKDRLRHQIINAYNTGDNETFRHATELFDQMFRGESYEDLLIREYDDNIAAELIDDSDNDRVEHGLAQVAMSALGPAERYPLNERLVNKGDNIIYCDRLNLGFRYDRHSGDTDRYSGHLHLFGRQQKPLGIIATLDEVVDESGAVDHRVFLEPHGGESRADAVSEYIKKMNNDKRSLICGVVASSIGKLPIEHRRNPSNNAILLSLDQN